MAWRSQQKKQKSLVDVSASTRFRINFIFAPAVKSAFDDLTNLDTLFLILQQQYNVVLKPRKSVIIFDEVQQFPPARQAIKYLVADGRYDYIETGSLISIKKNTKDITIPSEERRIGRKPDQMVQPFMFGDSYSKSTCLWIKNLRPLHPSKPTEDKGERIYFESGKSQPKWYSDGLTKTKSPEERQKWRSKTFPGIARAIAEQWSIQIAAEENLLDETEWQILGRDYLELLDKMTGGIRYTSATMDTELEKRKYPIHFKQELLDEIRRTG